MVIHIWGLIILLWMGLNNRRYTNIMSTKYKVGDRIYFKSFSKVDSMIVANITDICDDNPMYEDSKGNAVFEKDLVIC